MIVVTGGAVFIGSTIIRWLNNIGEEEIVDVDHLDFSEKWRNMVGSKFVDYLDRGNFLDKIQNNTLKYDVKICIHMGACSRTTEKDAKFLMENNFKCSQTLAKWALKNNIRFIYASSAATFGDSSNGFNDDENELDYLRTLNMYGYSKHMFDLWVIRKVYFSEFVGLKFFNVFRPNEYHKGDMRGVVLKGCE